MSSGFLKRLLLALLGILLVAVVAFAVILHNAFQATYTVNHKYQRIF